MEPHVKEAADLLEDKISKREAEYSPGNPEEGLNCGNCQFYVYPGNPESECHKVAGVVYDEDVCNLYAGQAQAMPGEAPDLENVSEFPSENSYG